MSEASGNGFGAFRFAVLNDLHYMDAVDRPWLEGIVQKVNTTPDVELCLVLGDLAENGTREELLAAKEILDELKMPYWVVPGNHDGPPGRETGGTGSLVEYEKLFPGRRNYTFEYKGWQFVALDTTEGSAWKDVKVRAETLAFAKETAAKLDPKRPAILFTHMPVAAGVPFGMVDGTELLKLFRRFRVPIVFSGHYHGFSRVVQDGVEMVTNRCCSMRREIHDGQTSRGYFVCEARADGSVGWEFVEFRGAVGGQGDTVTG